eukprot:4681055-Alexandrium_andersonii.AAC.1
MADPARKRRTRSLASPVQRCGNARGLHVTRVARAAQRPRAGGPHGPTEPDRPPRPERRAHAGPVG